MLPPVKQLENDGRLYNQGRIHTEGPTHAVVVFQTVETDPLLGHDTNLVEVYCIM